MFTPIKPLIEVFRKNCASKRYVRNAIPTVKNFVYKLSLDSFTYFAGLFSIRLAGFNENLNGLVKQFIPN